MVRNANWMADRLRFSPPRRFMPVRRAQLVQLPDEVLLRVLHALVLHDQTLHALVLHDQTLHARNVRDLWNVATTCRRMYALAIETLRVARMWRVVLDSQVPHAVTTAMADDVMHGLLLAVRVGGAGLRALKLGAMQCFQLDALLEQLARHQPSSLTELSFFDSHEGTTLPKQVASALKCVRIVSPHQRTLLQLRDANCAPNRLQLFRVEDDALSTVFSVWEALMRECSSADVTFMGGCYQVELYLPFTAIQRQRMNFWSWKEPYRMPFGEHRALSMRESGREHDGESIFGATLVRVAGWLRGMHARALNAMGSLTVVIEGASAAKALVANDGARWNRLMEQLALEHRGSGIDMLLMTVQPICERADARTVAQLAARIAAAAHGVRMFATSAVVFAELKDVQLPANLKSVGVVDSSVTSAFVRSLPAVLASLRKTARGERSVWVQSARLRDAGDTQRRVTQLLRAQDACRRAEAAGLCTVRVRGAIERWLRET
eukprot:TRINITY_DN74_c0_g1_i1.p1 TRINITY_DN74_c0_g1~~TRINITY_DN74_c0_g1_i1.p1  ORF type:complete len:493 (-),score=102.69 TRINITY_DN74_c0_g1_i1:1951-3429(-)